MSNQKIAQEVFEQVGGEKNIANATHCATRLRLNLKDNQQIDLKALDQIDGVIKAQLSNGQLQVVLGGKVNAVYEEFMNLLGGSTNERSSTVEKKKFSFGLLIETISGIFSPVLPVLIGCGMIQALNAVLVNFKLIDVESGLYQILQMTGDLIFYFLPFFLAVSAARKFKTSEYLAIALAAAFMYPTIMNGAMNAAETGIKSIDLLGLPVLFVNYKSTVFPIIFSVWVLSYLYRFIEKKTPEAFRILISPLLTLVIMIPLQLIVLGPAGSYLGNYIAVGVNYIYTAGGFLGAFLLGALRPVLVMFGMHYAITPIMVQELAETGITIILPALLVGNLAQSGAAFATGFLIKDKAQKSGAFTSAFTALCGITEPAMYGYNLKYKKPFYVALAAAGISAAYLSIFHAYSTAVALPGILALPTYHADNYIHIIIGVLIAIVGAFVGTLVIGIKQEPEQQAEVSKEISEKIYSPVNGKMQLLETVKDDVFSQKLMGDGVAFISNDGKIYAPISGEITMLFDTHHAIGIRSESGIEILIHVGLDTVNLKGAGFNPQVKVGDKVMNQQLLLTFDQEAIVEKGYDPIIPLVITNHSEFKDIRKKMNGTDLSVQTGDWIIEIEN
jgi:PTS system beta-glucosides-specific IIC component